MWAGKTKSFYTVGIKWQPLAMSAEPASEGPRIPLEPTASYALKK